MDAAHRAHAYELLDIELDQQDHRRTPSYSSIHTLHTDNEDNDATRALLHRPTGPTLDVHIERGFDVPVITQTLHSMQSQASSRPSSRTSLAYTEIIHDSHAQRGQNMIAGVLDQDDLDASMGVQSRSKKPHRQRKSLRKGWRAGVVAAAIMTTTVMLINLVLTVWATLHFGTDGGIGDAYVGDCDDVNRWSTALHVLINGLSSAMFSASNYTMQCLSAPTREDCDIAHTRGDWLDIGVSSVRNLARIRWPRRVAWGLLVMTSIPIHFLYNSAIFKELANIKGTYGSYPHVVAVSPQFLETAIIDFTAFPTFENKSLIWNMDGKNISRNASLYWNARPWGRPGGYYDEEPELEWYKSSVASSLHAAYHSNDTHFEELNPTECFALYSPKMLSGYSHLFLVLSGSTDFSNTSSQRPWSFFRSMWKTFPNSTDLALEENGTGITPYYWRSYVGAFQANGTLRDGLQFDHCLAKEVKRSCKLQFSVQILAVVIVCNCAKSVLMFWTLWQQQDETFLTFGDAIASWLDRPDDLTRGECLSSREVLRPTELYRRTMIHAVPDHELRQTDHIQPIGVQRWRSAVSAKRWQVTIAFCSVGIGVLIICLVLLTRRWDIDFFAALSPTQFGAVDTDLVLATLLPTKGAAGLISAVLVVNSPQLILSFCYLLYNGLFTCMHLSCEYSGYATKRKPLRVTTPRGDQRSTYWLQLPYTYGIPLIIASALLHWLFSQSIFLVRVVQYLDETGDDGLFHLLPKHTSRSEIGFSIAPILASIILALSMLLAVVGMGFRKLKSSIPVAGSCSFALAAATHRPKEDKDASVLPVMWGEVPGMGNDEVGHCCFTSQEVVELVPGRRYAGAQREMDERRVTTHEVLGS